MNKDFFILLFKESFECLQQTPAMKAHQSKFILLTSNNSRSQSFLSRQKGKKYAIKIPALENWSSRYLTEWEVMNVTWKSRKCYPKIYI